MGETEFLSDASSTDDERPIVTEPSRLGTAGTVGIAAGWLVAAALAAVAPWLPVVTLVLPGSPHRSIHGVDGWGRFPVELSGTLQHGPRFGIALWVCAAGLALLATGYLLGRRGRPEPRRDLATVAGAIAVPFLLAGVVGSLVLYGQAYRDEFGRSPTVRGATGQVQWGGCVWLSVAALVCAVGASAVLVRTSLRAGLSTR
jgi:hypothetical protein